MESSKILGGAEEYSSSESGWTMYIDSSIHGNDDPEEADHVTDDNSEDYHANNHHSNDESDDSMASDASSGPSHQKSLGIPYFKHAASKYSAKQEFHQQVKKGDQRRTTEKKGQSVLKAKSAASHVRSGAKVRKTD